MKNTDRNGLLNTSGFINLKNKGYKCYLIAN